MKNDSIRTEFLAIPAIAVIFGIGFAVLLAATEGPWAWILLGIAGLVLGAIVLMIAERRHRHPPAFDTPRAARADESDGGDGPYRVLIVADEGCTSPALAEELTERALGRRVEALVVAPALGSWLARWTDDDRRQADAQTHLATTMETLAAAGISARGETGSDDPIQAADDGLRRFAADEVMFVTSSGEAANWLERDVLESARERYDIRVTHTVVDAGDS